MKKINILKIVKDHHRCFVNSSTGELLKTDVFLFVILPLVVAALFICIGIELSANASNMLITALSVIAGLFLNLLVLIFDIVQKQTTPTDDEHERIRRKTRKELLKEIHANIAYCILISLMDVCLLLAIHLKFIKAFPSILAAITGVIYFLLFTLLLTLVMVLKRIYYILNREFENQISETL